MCSGINPFVFSLFGAGLCGGSASGKTTVANKIIEALDVPWVVLLSMDSFYKVGTPAFVPTGNVSPPGIKYS